MTSEKTKSYMVQAMIEETLDHGEQEVEVINNSCEAECHWTGGISPDVMLSGPPLCPETGFAATEVSLTYPAAETAPIRSDCRLVLMPVRQVIIHCNGIQAIEDAASAAPGSIAARAVYSCTGLMAVPAGFEQLVATLTFTKEADGAALSGPPCAAPCDESELACVNTVHTFVFEDPAAKSISPKAADSIAAPAAPAARPHAESAPSVRLLGMKVCAPRAELALLS